MDGTNEFQLLPRVFHFEAQYVPLERNQPELKLLDIERAEYAQVGEGGGAESGHARNDEEVVRMLIPLRHRFELGCSRVRGQPVI